MKVVALSLVVASAVAGCSTVRVADNTDDFVYTPPAPVGVVESMPLPPPRPFNLPKRCWIETHTTPHAVVERRICR